jgi:hypothetical protein
MKLRWAAATAIFAIGCAVPSPAVVPVAIYGRNAGPVDAWFATQPTDPLANVGFGNEIGVACWSVAAGSQVVMLDHAPSLGPASGVRAIATIGPQPDGRRQELWVDVAVDGSVASGIGRPAWWAGGPGC